MPSSILLLCSLIKLTSDGICSGVLLEISILIPAANPFMECLFRSRYRICRAPDKREGYSANPPLSDCPKSELDIKAENRNILVA
ncbi:MAG: hypothetical protein JL57_09270 [Desulfosporosinus sp. BICA1-9]|nr:MAG: hypothetical protein JL57_09270 [Desulfosporosinus sp. BICA1-9]